jgi:hypothetical protein
MNRDQEIRDEVLMQLVAAFPQAVPLARLHKTAKRTGLDFAEAELLRGVAYLCGLQPALAQEVINVALNETRYAATSAGVSHHERFGN